MGHLDPIAYTYEADHHCETCAEKAFGRNARGFIGEESFDSEGSPVGIVASWDEWWDYSEEGCEILSCGTCGGEIDTAHAEGCEENYGKNPCTLKRSETV